MSNFNRKISTNDSMIQIINKFNLFVDYVENIENQLITVHKKYIEHQKNETQPDENENSHDRFNFLMECASELKKICSERSACNKCPLSNEFDECMLQSVPECWNLKE